MGKDIDNAHFFSSKINNHILALGAAEEVTYNIVDNETDSSSSPYTIYFNFERRAIAVTVRASVVCALTRWNGKVLKSPITLNVGATPLAVGCTSFKVVSTAATVLEVTVK